MEAWDYWRLCDLLKVKDAADLLVGMLPGEVDAMAYNGAELWPSDRRKYHTRLAAVTSAIHAAIEGGRLSATLPKPLSGDIHPDLVGRVAVEDEVLDLNEAVIRADDLKKWLKEKGVRSGFFFPEVTEIVEPDYLDRNHPRYSPKLAAAVRAWQAVDDPGKKHPKQALLK